MFLSLAIAMVLIPANTATANEFMQNRKEYETALNQCHHSDRTFETGYGKHSKQDHCHS